MPCASILMQNPDSNPVGALKELCDFLRMPCEYDYAEEGPDHSRRVRGAAILMEQRIDADEWAAKRKDAQKLAAKKVVDMLPLLKIPDDVIPRVEKTTAYSSFKYEMLLTIRQEPRQFESEWHRKKEDAKRDFLRKVVAYCLDPAVHAKPGVDNDIPPPSLIIDDVEQRAILMLKNWQNTNMELIRKKIDTKSLLGPSEKLDNLLTVAFIHPSFAHSDSVRSAIKKTLQTDMTSYERLEFLGDAVLAMVSSKHIFDTFSADTPHAMTVRRQQVVREEACCKYMKRMALDQMIIHRDMLQTPSTKTVADVFEAVLGALYVIHQEESLPLVEELIFEGNSY